MSSINEDHPLMGAKREKTLEGDTHRPLINEDQNRNDKDECEQRDILCNEHSHSVNAIEEDHDFDPGKLEMEK